MTVFIHSKEDAMWVSLVAPPIEIKRVDIQLNKDSEFASIVLKFTETRTKIINKTSRRCRNYEENQTFQDCYTHSMWKFLEKNINCTLPGIQFDFLTVIKFRKRKGQHRRVGRVLAFGLRGTLV